MAVTVSKKDSLQENVVIRVALEVGKSLDTLTNVVYEYS
jgi:hypothetical protein